VFLDYFLLLDVLLIPVNHEVVVLDLVFGESYVCFLLGFVEEIL
jgi:hypothetical protein